MLSLRTSGASVAYRRTGTGPAVLLLQAVGVIGNGWHPQVEALPTRFTIVDIEPRHWREHDRSQRGHD